MTPSIPKSIESANIAKGAFGTGYTSKVASASNFLLLQNAGCASSCHASYLLLLTVDPFNKSLRGAKLSATWGMKR